MFKATPSCFGGFGRGIFGAMDQQWTELCSMIRDVEKNSDTKESKEDETLCSKLRMCVCSKEGQDAFHFHQNLVTLLKPSLAAKRKPRLPKTAPKPEGTKRVKPEYPPARLQMMAAFLIMKLEKVVEDAVVSEPNPGHHHSRPSSGVPSPWSAVLASRNVVPEDDSNVPEVLYFHVGYMNFSNWHFAGLELEVAHVENNGSVHLSVPERPVFHRILPFLRDRVNMKFTWSISFLQIRSTNDMVAATELVPGKVIADLYTEVPKFKVWHGSDAERFNRQRRSRTRKSASKEKKQETERKPGAKRKPKIKIPLGIEDAYGEDEIIDGILALNDEEEGLESDESIGSVVAGETSEEDVPDMLGAGHHGFKVWSSAKAKSNAKVKLPSKKNASSSATVAHSKSTASASAPPKAEPVSKVRTGTEVRFDLPGGIGHLCYYPNSKSFSAFCPKHVDCRRSRTAKAGCSSGQGRPLGHLLAWLSQAADYPDHKEHVKFCLPSLENRQEGRRLLQTCHGWESFANYERPRRAGESDEPDEIR